VERGHGAVGQVAHQRKVVEINMKVQHIKLVGLAPHLVQHDEMIGQ
jgi:hypothetical protein